MSLLNRIYSQFGWVAAHPGYRGMVTWVRYLWWLVSVVTRRTVEIRLVPYKSVVVVPPDLRGIARLLYLFRGEYEPELAILRDLVKLGGVAIDVGAHYGTYTAVLAELVGGDGRVIAIEPLPHAISIIRGTISANGFRNVEVIPAAAGAEEGRATLVEHADLSRTRVVSGDDIRVVTVDSLHLDRVDVLKIDVEGSERVVLSGASRTLLKRPVLIVEVTPRSSALAVIRAAGYIVYHVERGGLIEDGCTDPDEVSNFVCLHKRHRRADLLAAHCGLMVSSVR